jgi:hypothetical protein
MVKGSDYNSKGMHFDSEAEAQKALQEKLGSETRNYVTFSDDIVKIMRKYGVASMAALPPAVLYGLQQKYGQPSDDKEVY